MYGSRGLRQDMMYILAKNKDAINRNSTTVLSLLYTINLYSLRRRFKRQKYKGQINIDYRERGSHERDEYRTQDTSRIRTAMVK